MVILFAIKIQNGAVNTAPLLYYLIKKIIVDNFFKLSYNYQCE